MGRQAGLSAEAAERRILDAAARVFADRGYDRTRIGDVADDAGLTSGAIYNHFGSKAGLLRAVIDRHAGQFLADLLASDPSESTAAALRAGGIRLPTNRRPALIEAVVAARRDDQIRDAVASHLHQAEQDLADLISAAVDSGDGDPTLDPTAVARLVLYLALGAAALSVLEPGDVDPVAWSRVVDRLMTAMSG